MKAGHETQEGVWVLPSMNLLPVGICVCSLIFLAGVVQGDPLTNDDVIALHEAGLGDDVVIAKVNQSEEVDFALEVEDLTALRSAGLSSVVITAMLDRTAPPEAPASPDLAAVTSAYSPQDSGLQMISVRLEVSEGTERLTMVRGEMTSTGFSIYRNTFMDYAGLHARVRTRDSMPTLLVTSSTPLSGSRYFLAKLDSDTDDGVRSLKISSAGQRFRSMFGSSRQMMEPDPDWVVEWTAEEVQNGLWRVTPDQPLAPGEYGWYVDLGTTVQARGLYDFGVDP